MELVDYSKHYMTVEIYIIVLIHLLILINRFDGPNFIGKLKTTKDHIQFISYIKKKIDLPDDIINDAYSAFSNKYSKHNKPSNPQKNIKNIRDNFDNISFYLFEISSLKLRLRNNYYVSDENTTNYTQKVMTETELYNDLNYIIDLIGENKNIIFINHFRLQTFNCGPIIKNREIIYKVIQKVCNEKKNIYHYDPSIYLTKKNSKSYLYDPWHYTQQGYLYNFQHLNNFIKTIRNKTASKNINKVISINNYELNDSEDEEPDYHRSNMLK